MKKSKFNLTTLFALYAIACNAAVAAGPGAGGGGGGGGSGGGGQGGGGGGEQGSILGDIAVLYRDADGIPILTTDRCQQPLAAPGVAVPNCPQTTTTPDGESCILPVDPATCAVDPAFATYLQEVDFGRISVSRSPADVIERQLNDVLVTLSTSSCNLSLDPSGRLVFFSPDTDDSDGDSNTTELVSSEIDSPLQNLAIYKELMVKGVLGVPAINLPSPFTGYNFLDTAAKGVGAAADKGGKISVDLIVNLNQILGLSNKDSTTVLPKSCITVREEVKGAVQDVEKCFVNYRAYSYNRAQTYGNLPFPAYIPAGTPVPGTFEFLAEYPLDPPLSFPVFAIQQGLINDVVFGGQPGFTAGNIGGFAQASDDARKVIEFTHDHPVLEGYGTPVPCTGTPPAPTPSFDAALSALQMPIRMVANSVREGTVTVTNNGPNAATGQVKLNGTDSGGFNLSQNFDFTNLAAGQSQSWTVTFTSPAYATTISWNATVVAPGDVLSSNDTFTASTQVFARAGSPGRSDSDR